MITVTGLMRANNRTARAARILNAFIYLTSSTKTRHQFRKFEVLTGESCILCCYVKSLSCQSRNLKMTHCLICPTIQIWNNCNTLNLPQSCILKGYLNCSSHRRSLNSLLSILYVYHKQIMTVTMILHSAHTIPCAGRLVQTNQRCCGHQDQSDCHYDSKDKISSTGKKRCNERNSRLLVKTMDRA